MRSLPARTSVAALLVAFSAASVTIAHEGHGHPEMQTGLMHYVSSPVHLVPVLLAAAVISCAAAYGFRRVRSSRKQKAVAVRAE